MIRRRRRAIKWSQQDLAFAVGLAQSTISRLEAGTLTGIRFDRFARIVAALDGLDPDTPFPRVLPRRAYFADFVSWQTADIASRKASETTSLD